MMMAPKPYAIVVDGSHEITNDQQACAIFNSYMDGVVYPERHLFIYKPNDKSSSDLLAVHILKHNEQRCRHTPVFYDGKNIAVVSEIAPCVEAIRRALLFELRNTFPTCAYNVREEGCLNARNVPFYGCTATSYIKNTLAREFEKQYPTYLVTHELSGRVNIACDAVDDLMVPLAMHKMMLYRYTNWDLKMYILAKALPMNDRARSYNEATFKLELEIWEPILTDDEARGYVTTRDLNHFEELINDDENHVRIPHSTNRRASQGFDLRLAGKYVAVYDSKAQIRLIEMVSKNRPISGPMVNDTLKVEVADYVQEYRYVPAQTALPFTWTRNPVQQQSPRHTCYLNIKSLLLKISKYWRSNNGNQSGNLPRAGTVVDNLRRDAYKVVQIQDRDGRQVYQIE